MLGDAFDAAAKTAIEKEITDAKPGEIVILKKPPYAINIYKEIKDTDVHLWNENNTVLRDLISKQKWVVIPLTQSSYPVEYTVKPKFEIHYYSIRVTFGFAKPVHKSQPLNEDTALVDLNQRPNGMFGWTL